MERPFLDQLPVHHQQLVRRAPKRSSASSPARSAARPRSGSPSTRLLSTCRPHASRGSSPLLTERSGRERLRALARIEGLDLSTEPWILFMCVRSSARSQMAAGWLRHLAGGSIVVWSAGSEPGLEVNPAVVEAMTEVGIDVASARAARDELHVRVEDLVASLRQDVR